MCIYVYKRETGRGNKYALSIIWYLLFDFFFFLRTKRFFPWLFKYLMLNLIRDRGDTTIKIDNADSKDWHFKHSLFNFYCVKCLRLSSFVGSGIFRENAIVVFVYSFCNLKTLWVDELFCFWFLTENIESHRIICKTTKSIILYYFLLTVSLLYSCSSSIENQKYDSSSTLFFFCGYLRKEKKYLLVWQWKNTSAYLK